MEWAGLQTERITSERQEEAAAMLQGYDIQSASYTVDLALQETVANRIRTTTPKLAGVGMGLEFWRLLVRGHEAPEQPLVQRARRQRWNYPTRCKTSPSSEYASQSGSAGGGSSRRSLGCPWTR